MAVKSEKENKDYSLCDDCSPFEGLYEYCRLIAGSTITACTALKTHIVLNWEGGRHHAKKSTAAGFCYVNDIVLGIFELQKTYSRILYLDLDVHHGDGVQDAFYSSDSVFTVSFHMHGPGLYPGTGFIEEIGKGRGEGFNLNVPLPEFTGDVTYWKIFEPIVKKVVGKYDPQVIVMVCGADSLYNDPLGGFCLSSQLYAKCVRMVKDFKIPLVILGGGGYHPTNTARLWTIITAIALAVELPNEIPEESKYYEEYKVGNFQLDVPGITLGDTMDDKSIKGLLDQLFENLDSGAE